jgi:predicted acyltransferase
MSEPAHSTGAGTETIPGESKGSSRLLSLDALRGFDMFWIVGAEEVVHALSKMSDTGFAAFLSRQLSHKPWTGIVFYDLIFPLFVFIVGVSLVFSLTRSLENNGRWPTCMKIVRRAALLYLIGLIYYGGISEGWDKIRFLGVLQRIALCYLATGLMFVFLRKRGLVAVCLALLVGYWVLMTWVPVPGIGAGNFEEGKNLANYIDRMVLPGFKWDGDHDPEGLLSTLPAIATCLLGVFAGLFLKQPGCPEQRKVWFLVGAGATAVIVGFAWGLQFPVIKKIWTSSYVLVAGGYSCLLLAAFYQIIEIWGCRSWAMPFVWIGVNPITIYLVHNLVDLNKLANRLVGGPVKATLDNYGELLVATVVLALSLWFARFLYRRQIFLRL